MYAYAMAVPLLIIEAEMLDTGSHAVALHTSHILYCQLAGQIGVFTHILKVAASQGCAVDIEAGA